MPLNRIELIENCCFISSFSKKRLILLIILVTV